jgi:hypothetical protein
MYLFIESLKGLFHYNGSIYLQHFFLFLSLVNLVSELFRHLQNNAGTKKKAGLEEMGH